MGLGARSKKIAKLSKLENFRNEQEGNFQREFARSWDIIRGSKEPQRLLEKMKRWTIRFDKDKEHLFLVPNNQKEEPSFR